MEPSDIAVELLGNRQDVLDIDGTWQLTWAPFDSWPATFEDLSSAACRPPNAPSRGCPSKGDSAAIIEGSVERSGRTLTYELEGGNLSSETCPPTTVEANAKGVCPAGEPFVLGVTGVALLTE